MSGQWTFGQRIAAGFTVTIVLTIIIGAVAVTTLRNVIDSKDRVIDVNAQMLVDAQALQTAREQKSVAVRGFLLSPSSEEMAKLQAARNAVRDSLERLRAAAYTDDGRRLLDSIDQADREHQTGIDRVVEIRRTQSMEAAVAAFDQLLPVRDRLSGQVQSFLDRERTRMAEARQASNATALRSEWALELLVVVVIVFGTLAAIGLTRTLTRQIGSAVGRVQSSSTELQAAATQQATGSREQATAMSEISTTINELLASSRQIAESAQRVASIAAQTARAAKDGDATVSGAHESINAIRAQTDLIVNHMLELGRKSQQIGAVLEIVSELAEQTNILAINATIEAAGAGESGKRFAVVADEIRKLADRVTLSAKEIRGLIDDVRGAVNATVMVTETGSKAVDAGSRQFAQVAASFKQIVDMVETTTEAAREIELSTKQQMTAVEQVNSAIGNVAQASKETETSSGQTQQTAAELAVLSKDLMRLVQPQSAA